MEGFYKRFQVIILWRQQSFWVVGSKNERLVEPVGIRGRSGRLYPGFPLSLSHAQLNPHGLVYMTSPYLQGIGSSSLHCFRLHFAKDATIGNTAGATVRQLVSLVFERVVIEDASSNEESVSTTNESFPNASKEFSKLPDYPLKSLKPFAWMHGCICSLSSNSLYSFDSVLWFRNFCFYFCAHPPHP